MTDEYNQPEYISIQVCDPITIADESGSYTRYTVKTETTFPEYRKKVFQVFRRYSEFKALRELLKTEFDSNPKAIKFGELPPLPGDTIFSLFSKQARLDPAFIEKRREGLEAFINSVANHNALRFMPCLHNFLQDEHFNQTL